MEKLFRDCDKVYLLAAGRNDIGHTALLEKFGIDAVTVGTDLSSDIYCDLRNIANVKECVEKNLSAKIVIVDLRSLEFIRSLDTPNSVYEIMSHFVCHDGILIMEYPYYGMKFLDEDYKKLCNEAFYEKKSTYLTANFSAIVVPKKYYESDGTPVRQTVIDAPRLNFLRNYGNGLLGKIDTGVINTPKQVIEELSLHESKDISKMPNFESSSLKLRDLVSIFINRKYESTYPDPIDFYKPEADKKVFAHLRTIFSEVEIIEDIYPTSPQYFQNGMTKYLVCKKS